MRLSSLQWKEVIPESNGRGEEGVQMAGGSTEWDNKVEIGRITEGTSWRLMLTLGAVEWCR